ncbi:MAG: hypothetical protein ACQER7_04255 [Bacteroidota bacterium]
MKKMFLTCVFILFVSLSFVFAQDFIGKTREEIKTLMQQSEKALSFTKEVNTDKYHYLKFENEENTKTMLFILSDKGVCDYTKLMCDYSLLKSVIDSLNDNYQYQKDQTWIDYESDQEKDYLIELEKQDWFFTLKTSQL